MRLNMDDRYDALERVQRLRETGVLSEEEFVAEKQRIISGARAVVGRNRTWPYWTAGGIAVVVLAVAAAGVWLGLPSKSREANTSGAASTQLIGNSDLDTPVSPTVGNLPMAEQLSLAASVALGVPSRKVQRLGGETIITKAERLIRLPFGPVLLTSVEIKDGCHACVGALGVYYLKETGDRFEAVRRFPKAVEGWGWGSPPSEWTVSEKFTTYPAIFAEGGFTGQGITCSSATITELKPEGPVTSDLINTGFDNSGAVLDDTGQTGGGDSAQSLEGKIGNIQRGRSFVIQVTGKERFMETYVMKGGRFVRTSGDTRLGC
jgi:hypothetical protein